MICNDLQLEITRGWIERFRSHLVEIDAADLPEDRRARHRSSVNAQIADLEEEVATYKRLLKGDLGALEGFTFETLPKLLIAARLARGLSLAELGARIGITEEAMKALEDADHDETPLWQARELAEALGLDGTFSVRAELPAAYSEETSAGS